MPVCSHGRHASLICTAPPPPELYTLSLHDALPISTAILPVQAGCSWLLIPGYPRLPGDCALRVACQAASGFQRAVADRKSTRLNSSHSSISYAVFCLKKKTYVFVGVVERVDELSGP